MWVIYSKKVIQLMIHVNACTFECLQTIEQGLASRLIHNGLFCTWVFGSSAVIDVDIWIHNYQTAISSIYCPFAMWTWVIQFALSFSSACYKLWAHGLLQTSCPPGWPRSFFIHCLWWIFNFKYLVKMCGRVVKNEAIRQCESLLLTFGSCFLQTKYLLFCSS